MNIHASINPDRIRNKFTKWLKTGDIGFTMTVVCKSGVEVSGELIGRSKQGLSSGAVHFGRHLAVPCRNHERIQAQAGKRPSMSSPALSARASSSSALAGNAAMTEVRTRETNLS